MALEAEEEGMAAADEAAAAALAAEAEPEEGEAEEEALHAAIRRRKALLLEKHRGSKALNRPSVPRHLKHHTEAELREGLAGVGVPAATAAAAAAAAAGGGRAASASASSSSSSAAAGAPVRGRKRTRAEDAAAAMDEDGGVAEEDDDEEGAAGGGARAASRSASRGLSAGPGKRVRASSASRARDIVLLAKYGGDPRAAAQGRIDRSMEPPRAPAAKVGLPSEKVRDRAVKDFNKYRSKKFEGKQGESDNRIPDRKPKWMLSGKRGNGKTDRR